MKYFNTLLIALLASFTLVACDVDEGPMEETGESVDEATDDMGDAAEDTAEDAEEAVE